MANENLQNALTDAGLTIEQFADVLRVDPKSVQRWVTGTTIPYPRHRHAITRALHLTEQQLWPGQLPAPQPNPDASITDGYCDVVGSWAYADEPTIPELGWLIADSSGPVDILDSPFGLELTSELTDQLARHAAAGHQVRVLTSNPTRQLALLASQPGVGLLVADTWMEFWFLRAGDRMLFTINFQDNVATDPPPVLELTGRITGGLFDRAQNKFEDLWQTALKDPQTLRDTETELNTILAHTSVRDSSTANDPAAPDNDSHAARECSAPPDTQAPPPPSVHTSPPAETQPRRWPGRPS